VAGIDFFACIAVAEPALESERQRRTDIAVMQRHDELRRRMRMARARMQQTIDEIRAIQVQPVDRVTRLRRIARGTRTFGDAQP